jgi:hypothetical protein
VQPTRTRTGRRRGETYGAWLRRQETGGREPFAERSRGGKAAYVLGVFVYVGFLGLRVSRRPTLTKPEWLLAAAVGAAAVVAFARWQERLPKPVGWALLLVGAAGLFLGMILSGT